MNYEKFLDHSRTCRLIFCSSSPAAYAQPLEKVLITHSSDSVSITPLLYGIERGFYRAEGIDLQFRVLRGELAVSAIISGKDVDYIYGAGTAFFAAVRGVPMKVFSHDFKSVFFYLMGSPRIQSGQDLKGKKSPWHPGAAPAPRRPGLRSKRSASMPNGTSL